LRENESDIASNKSALARLVPRPLHHGFSPFLSNNPFISHAKRVYCGIMCGIQMKQRHATGRASADPLLAMSLSFSLKSPFYFSRKGEKEAIALIFS
jgi:hypothetical protein